MDLLSTVQLRCIIQHLKPRAVFIGLALKHSAGSGNQITL